MSTFSGNRTIKLWTCCQCRENGISMSLGECPKCEDHSRCYDCDVKSHAASDAEIEEEGLKIARSAGRDSSVASSRGQPSFEPESSSAASNVTTSVGRVVHTLPSGHTPSLPRISSSGTQFASIGTATRAPLGTLIRVAVISENDPVYVLREQDDANLTTTWNQTLPSISENCRNASRNIVSIHLFRIGKSEESSTPTVIVNTKGLLLDEEKEDILLAISFSRGPGSLPTYINSNSIQLVFRQSRLRRSVDSSGTDEPPICEPRNRQFSTLPSTGNSIGIAGSIRDTATLGCYLLIGVVPYILTVDHLLPSRSAAFLLTHISEQDQHALTVKALDVEIRRLMAATAHSCHLCDPKLTDRESAQGSLRAFHVLRILKSGKPPWCSFLLDLIEWYINPESLQYPSCVVARNCVSSGRRCRTFENVTREMDWAIFGVVNYAPLHLLPKLLSQHDEVRSHFGNDLTGAQNIKPGAFVVSVGRTSGCQKGIISTTLSSIFHEEYVTQEWCVIKREENSVDEWVEGGIGVEGDSGALIMDESTMEIYGMLWGRTGDGAATVTIFTPLWEIFEDIESRFPFTRVEILKGQSIRPFVEPASPPPVRGSIPPVPLPFQPFEITVEDDVLISNLTILGQLVAPIPTVPISIQLDEKEEDHNQPFEQTFSSLSLTRQSSTVPVRRLPFKRYHKHDRSISDQDIGLGPSTPRQEREDKVESKSWPGTHTYLRYALGDQG